MTDLALDTLQACLAKDGAFWRAHVRIGLILEKGDAAKALKHFERALALNPKQPDVQARIEKLSSSY